MEYASLRENLQGTRRSIVPYDEDKSTPELQERRRRLANQLDALSLQLTARTDALEGIIPSGPRITPEQLCTGDQSIRGFLIDGDSEYNQQDHFLGVVTWPDRITRPDDKG